MLILRNTVSSSSLITAAGLDSSTADHSKDKIKEMHVVLASSVSIEWKHLHNVVNVQSRMAIESPQVFVTWILFERSSRRT